MTVRGHSTSWYPEVLAASVKILGSMGVGVAVFCAVACGEGADGASLGPLGDGTLVTKHLDQAGGTVAHPDGAELEVPAGALGARTEVGMEDLEVPATLPTGLAAQGRALSLRPYETELAMPAQLRLPFAGELAVGEELIVMRSSSETAAGWEELEVAAVDGGRVTVTIETFGVFAVTRPGANSVSAKVARDGGELIHPDGARLTVPAGALAEPARLTITRADPSPTAFGAELEAPGAAYAFTPHRKGFEQEVSLVLPFEDDASRPDDALRVMRLDDENDATWEEVAEASFDRKERSAHVRVSRFSFYQVAWAVSRVEMDSGIDGGSGAALDAGAEGMADGGGDLDAGTPPACGPGSEPACTVEQGCQVVDGKHIYVVTSQSAMTGHEVCAQQGLVCVDEDNTGLGPCSGDCKGLPIFASRHAACEAFHPTALLTNDASGWGQSIFCAGNEGLACVSDGCHYCSACNVDSLTCGLRPSLSTQLSEVYARCDPTPCAPD